MMQRERRDDQLLSVADVVSRRDGTVTLEAIVAKELDRDYCPTFVRGLSS